MGGNAFPDLNTPRLTHDEYNLIRDNCTVILQQFYDKVICAPEGPEKNDHGDVDLLVSHQKSELKQRDSLQSALNAVSRTKAGVTTSFAVPLPDKRDIYAQVDVHLCRDEFLEWELWMGGYGDLVQILGVLNRSIGLTMNDKGLHVRVPEVEPANRKASMIHLTSDPSKVMGFLGLDMVKYKQGFATMDEIFSWCSAGRFYGSPRPRDRNENETANDRARAKKRPMFARFFNEWVPANPNSWKNEERWPRGKVLQEAIEVFEAQEQYEAIMSTWRQQARESTIIETIKAAIPDEGVRLATTMRALKRWTAFKDGRPELRLEDDPNNIEKLPEWLRYLSDEDMGAFLEWVKANYAEIRRRERHRSEARRQHGEASAGECQLKLD